MKSVRAFEITEEQRNDYSGPNNTMACWAWCMDQFGTPGTRWTWDTFNRFWFYNDRDATLFALRWSR